MKIEPGRIINDFLYSARSNKPAEKDDKLYYT